MKSSVKSSSRPKTKAMVRAVRNCASPVFSAVRFCDSFFGCFNVNEAASELGFYLSIAGGFDMLPSDGSSSKKNGSSTLSS